jgi:hypothetical protein
LYGSTPRADGVEPFPCTVLGPVHSVRRETRVKHTHFSVIAASQAFLSVVIIGTLFRLVALHLMASDNPTANQIGQGMSFQY